MKKNARVVVIGGGVVGVATLYHLTLKGWNDVILMERRELTSGSTWHAAGLLPLFNMSYSVGQIHKYSVELYGRLAEETGQDVGLRRVSNIRLATTQDRMDEYYQYSGVAKTIGVEVEFLTPEDVLVAWPFACKDGLLGAIRHPQDGYIQPADLTQALALGARKRGAQIYRQTTVNEIIQKPNDEWLVKTNKGDVVCEHIVSATGNFARRTGQMVGLEIPVIPVEHQYIVTESHPDILARRSQNLPEMGVLRESDGSWYMREEAGGLLLGPYEKGAPACYIDGPDENAEYELFPEDIDRLTPHIESAVKRVPIFGKLGVKTVYNGAIAYTPDGSPIIGPAWGLKNFWLNEGHSFGITAAGGAGWQLAEWIVEGEPTIDMLGVDPRRFGDYASKMYLVEKAEEAYANVFTVHYPDEEREAGRPLRMAPCYDRMKSLGAVFGQKFGWERPNWFATKNAPQKDHWSFRRSSWFQFCGGECLNVMEKAGLLDMTAFAKIRVYGPDSEKFLSYFFANHLPAKTGRLTLCHALTTRGGVHSEFTVYREAPDSFYLVSAGMYQRLDHDWLKRHVPNGASVYFEDLTNSIGVLVVAGPNSRDIIERSIKEDTGNKKFPWLTGQDHTIGYAPARLLRVNFVGELGWEIHHGLEYQNHIFDTLMKNGEDLGIKPFGIRAMDSMRIEKSYRVIGTEMSIEYSAFESGLQRFVKTDKDSFKGKDALLQAKKKESPNQFVTLEVKGHNEADAIGNNPIYHQGELVGRATSGNYGFRVGKSLALAMLRPDVAILGTELEIDVLGTTCSAKVIGESPYDPENLKLRA